MVAVAAAAVAVVVVAVAVVAVVIVAVVAVVTVAVAVVVVAVVAVAAMAAISEMRLQPTPPRQAISRTMTTDSSMMTRCERPNMVPGVVVPMAGAAHSVVAHGDVDGK